MPNEEPVTTAAACRALAIANGRYWTSVHPHVRTELRRWGRRAAAIPDPGWRSLALDKLAAEQFNAQVAATLATLVPGRRRATVVRAIVAAEVLYDYLDGASEHAAPAGRFLYDAFATMLGDHFDTAHCFADLPTDDGGYLAALAATCRRELERLPAANAVHGVARQAADRCATAQTLTHRIAVAGVGPLRDWSREPAERRGLAWWEYAAGGAASILAVHALLAAAGSPSTTAADAAAIGEAYLLSGALSTVLDSLVDERADRVASTHSFVGYYRDPAARAAGVAAIARQALLAAERLPHAPHHAMTVAGVGGYYLSALTTDPAHREVAAAVKAEFGPVLPPILAIFAAWRAAKRLRARTRRYSPRIGAEN